MFWVGSTYANLEYDDAALEYLHAAPVRSPERISIVRMFDADLVRACDQKLSVACAEFKPRTLPAAAEVRGSRQAMMH